MAPVPERARKLDINGAAAARQGVAAAVRAALVANDRAASTRHPERPDPDWDDTEAWSQE